MPNKRYESHIGIDISKDFLDVYIRPTGRSFRKNNDEEGIQELQECLLDHKKGLIVVESTGKYGSFMVEALQKAGFTVAVVNALRIRNYGKALGKLAKTDKLDASLIAHFGENFEPMEARIVTEDEKELNELHRRRDQLIEMLTMEKNRLAQAKGTVAVQITEMIEFLKGKIKEVERKLSEHIQKNESWQSKKELLCSVKGVGETTATALISELPELGNVNDKQLAALVGVAPLNKDSGNFKGQRGIWGGRAGVRKALYMSTIVAVRHNPQLKVFYERLLLSGKKKKVALIACMRKLLIIMNAMIRKGTRWGEHIPVAT